MPNLKVMTFNILDGAPGGRLGRVCETIRHMAPDVLVLQECMNWMENDPKLGEVAAALGIQVSPEHVLFGLAEDRDHPNRHHVVAFSRPKMLRRQVHHDHDRISKVEVEFDVAWGLDVLTVIGLHLNAGPLHSGGGKGYRLKEVDYLLDQVVGQPFDDRKMLLAGDLNSLSPRDPYSSMEELGQQMEALGKGGKFGNPPGFQVIGKLEAFGWRDALYEKGTPPTWITAERGQDGTRVMLREDYIFLSPSLTASLLACQVGPYDSDVSDHAPVMATLAQPD